MFSIPVQIPKKEKLIGSVWITRSPLILSTVAMGERGHTLQKIWRGDKEESGYPKTDLLQQAKA